ncbi:MAG TPA: S-layer protein domain-containing protein [Methanosarcina sp.]
MNKVILQIFTALLILGLFCGAATAAPSAKFTANITEGVLPLSVSFQNQSQNVTSWQWNFGDGSSNSSEGNPTHTYTNAGKYTVNLTVTDSNGTSDTTSKKNYITVLASSNSSAAFEANVTNGSVPLIVGFTDKSTNAESWQWNFGDGSSNSTEQNPIHTYTSSGTYKVTLTTTDTSGNNQVSTKNIEVDSSDSGNRIWEDGMPTTYTWNAQSFSGFYYDLNSGVSSEEMTITDIGRSIDSGNIEYVTRPTETSFEHNGWGSYQVVGFMAEKYFAGYTKDNSTVIGDDISPISDGVLSKILTDNDDKKSLNTGESLALQEGYSLNIVEVDVNGKSVRVQLEKDGKVVDEGFISSGNDYVYKTDFGGSKDVPIIIVHFGSVFQGSETSAVFIQGVFQISDNYTKIKSGDDFGEMEVTSLSSDEIIMKNKDNVGLDQGNTIDLMGKIKFQVADDSTLRFAPVLDTSEAGTYELRGTVYDESIDNSLPTWTPFNFEGFYYNIDEGIGTENMTVQEFDGKSIPSDKLVYKSTPQAVKFEHNGWGNFTVVGFMADKYFAGYSDGSVDGAVDHVSLLSNNILTKVLTDNDDKKSLNTGDSLALQDGYSLNIVEVDVNGKSVRVQLEKDGNVVDEGFITSGQDYVYKADLGKATDIPLIIVHFGSVFQGSETSAVFIQGVFQLSSTYTEISSGDDFGKMEVTDVSDNGITMKNKDDIGLGQDQTTNIMGNVSFKTADNSTLRFYPFVEVENGGNASDALNINVPDKIYAGNPFNIQVTAGNKSVEGATVKVNDSSAGNTSKDGIVEYTAENAGSLSVTAEKDGYTTASKNININPHQEEMSLNVSPETVYVGDTATIQILKKIGGNPIEGANVSIDGKDLGKTGSDGKITYKTDKSGTLKVSATQENFTDVDFDLKVKDLEANFTVSNLSVNPIKVSAGENTNISAIVENVGKAAGNKSVELSINGNVTDSKEVSLDVGKNTTVTFEHAEKMPGNYTVEVGGQTVAYTVTEKSSLPLYALLLIILLIVGGAAYYFTKGGGDIGALQEKFKELTRK